eukprot:comp9265_c0_seq1/m.10623 comp9265_c0_seq1/g.10623  ORF comp9265_c0_seq1/g.10623 comp9265_c0_seq1/m.10623 type:complete len:310 (-) comp9265_c0_seq1:4157-5086(-)
MSLIDDSRSGVCTNVAVNGAVGNPGLRSLKDTDETLFIAASITIVSSTSGSVAFSSSGHVQRPASSVSITRVRAMLPTRSGSNTALKRRMRVFEIDDVSGTSRSPGAGSGEIVVVYGICWCSLSVSVPWISRSNCSSVRSRVRHVSLRVAVDANTGMPVTGYSHVRSSSSHCTESAPRLRAISPLGAKLIGNCVAENGATVVLVLRVSNVNAGSTETLTWIGRGNGLRNATICVALSFTGATTSTGSSLDGITPMPVAWNTHCPSFWFSTRIVTFSSRPIDDGVYTSVNVADVSPAGITRARGSRGSTA